MEKILFIKEFLKNWRGVGSVTPSSSFLVDKMLAPIDFSKANTIVEIGAGSGVITREILKKMKPDAKLLTFETNEGFCRVLGNIHDLRLTVCNESALNITRQIGPVQADYIVSGIPLATLLPEDKMQLLIACYKTLVPQGRYIQFQYSFESRKDLKKVFPEVSVDFTLLNIPPALVYTCVKK